MHFGTYIAGHFDEAVMLPVTATPAPVAPTDIPAGQPPRLLDPLYQLALQRGHSRDTAIDYVEWSRRYILFHGKRHPRQLGHPEILPFLEGVAHAESQRLVAVARAREALEFLYQELLHQEMGELPRARQHENEGGSFCLAPGSCRSTRARAARGGIMCFRRRSTGRSRLLAAHFEAATPCDAWKPRHNLKASEVSKK
jgi:hypothetical protein